jgi:putative zinc finger protein
MSARDAETPALRCTGEPPSWLALERLRLGELPPAERSAVEQHLAACAACAACLAEIDRPLSLPALPTVPGRASLWSRLQGIWRRAGRVHIWATAGVTLLLVLFVLARPKRLDDGLTDRTLAGVKGNGIALTLVRERNGAIEHDATTFAPGDRWKALVTCPSARMVFWDLAIIGSRGETFPLTPAGPIACGNRVPLPGAFRLDGSGPVVVGLLLDANPIDRTHAGEAVTGVQLQPER